MVPPHMWSEGGFNQEELNRIAYGLKLVGELADPPDWSRLIDRSFLPDDLKAGQ